MKKINLFLIPLFSILLLSACEYDDDYIEDLDSKISELQAYNGDNIYDVINDLEDQNLYVESNYNGVVQLTNSNGSIVYIFYINNDNSISESRFEYYTEMPTVALDRFGKWHNSAYNLNYSRYYYGEITYLDNVTNTYRNEDDFMENFEEFGADIYNCYEEWNSSHYGCNIEYHVVNISTRKVSVGCFDIDKKIENKNTINKK